MFNDTRLLVVDDEDAICRGCRRILTSEGYRVDTANDAHRGLSLAVANDYAAVLLDIRMPQMDGIEFLEKLRKSKREVPVIIITGYPSIATAASAMQLGAVDYVMKPFTPRAITRAVRRLLGPQDSEQTSAPAPSPSMVQQWIPTTTEFRYWDEAWFQPVKGGAVRVGAMLPRTRGGTVEVVWPPRIGWIVHRGLPLAGATIADQSHFTVPSPITGEVVASNDLLFESPSLLWDEPCGSGWIACIRPTRFEEERRDCKVRHVVLASADTAGVSEHAARLASFGCRVTIAGGLGDVGPTLERNPDCEVLMLETESCGERGPELVQRINDARPSIRVVVVAPRRCKWEAAYREQGIFYYAVDPFGDNEIVDIVDAAFRPHVPHRPPVKPQRSSSTPVGRICATAHAGERIGLVADKGLLQKELGLGLHITHKLADRDCSVQTTPGTRSLASAIQEAASSCDRVLTLLARDVGRLPGTLVRETCVPTSVDEAGKVTNLIIQRAPAPGDPLDFDIRTTMSLAEHIVHEMALC